MVVESSTKLIAVKPEELLEAQMIPYKGLESVQLGEGAKFYPTNDGLNIKEIVRLEGEANVGEIKLGDIAFKFRRDDIRSSIKVAFVDNAPNSDVQILCTDQKNIFWSHYLGDTPVTDRRVKSVGVGSHKETLIVVGEKEIKESEVTEMPLIVLRVWDRVTKLYKQYHIRTNYKNDQIDCEAREGVIKNEYDLLVDSIAEAEKSGDEKLYMQRLEMLLRSIQKSIDQITWGGDLGNTYKRMPRLENVLASKSEELTKPWGPGEDFRIVSKHAETIDNNGQPSVGIASDNTGRIVASRYNSYTQGRYVKFECIPNPGNLPDLRSSYGIWIMLLKMGSKLPEK